jgi:cold shock CspA family protein
MPDHEESGQSPAEAARPVRPQSRRRTAPAVEAPTAIESAASADTSATSDETSALRPARRTRRASAAIEAANAEAPAAVAPVRRRATRARPADALTDETPAADAPPRTRRARAAVTATAPEEPLVADKPAGRRRVRPAAAGTDAVDGERAVAASPAAAAPSVLAEVALTPDPGAPGAVAPESDDGAPIVAAEPSRRRTRRPVARTVAATPPLAVSAVPTPLESVEPVEAAPVPAPEPASPTVAAAEAAPTTATNPAADGPGFAASRGRRRGRGHGAPPPREQPNGPAAASEGQPAPAPDSPRRGPRPMPRYGEPDTGRRGPGAPRPAARGAPGGPHPAARRADPRTPGYGSRPQPPDPRQRQPGQAFGRPRPGAPPARPGGPPGRTAGPPPRAGGPPLREPPEDLRPRRGPIVDPRQRLTPEEKSAISARGTRGSQMLGKIAEMSRDRGFGFIMDNAGRKRFFHRSAVMNSAFDTLREGQQVHFEPRDDVKGLRAINVRPAAVPRARPGARQAPWERGNQRLDADPPRRPAAARRPGGTAPGAPAWRSSLSPFRGDPPSASPPRRRRG